MHFIGLPSAHKEVDCTFSYRVFSIEIQKVSEILKENKKFIKIFENTDSKKKKIERFLENANFVHWVSVDYKLGLTFTEPRYQK